MQLSPQTIQIVSSLLNGQSLSAAQEDLVERAGLIAVTRHALRRAGEGEEVTLNDESVKMLLELMEPVLNQLRGQLKSVETAQQELRPTRQARRAQERSEEKGLKAV